MDFADRVKAIADKVRANRDKIETEEGTKNAFIMPFIATVLGYDVFNPSEVTPEFIADVGVKKGEKIDYALLKDGEVSILMECKKVGDPLSLKYASQLFRYFAATSARIAILTNGEQYHVYTDGDRPNRMDDEPFLVFDLLDIDRTLLPELKKLSKESFDLDSIVNAAEELKYVGLVRRALAEEVKEPSDDWVAFFASKVYEGRRTKAVIDQFRPVVKKSVSQYISEQVNDRLKSALGEYSEEPAATIPAPAVVTTPEPADEAVRVEAVASDIVTTEDELQGFNIVRAIAAADVPVERIVHRDAKSYFAILLDDNNRKPLIRLYLNGKSVKYLTTYDVETREWERADIETVVDIYKVADRIRKTIHQYESSLVSQPAG